MKNQIVASIAALPFALGAAFAGTGAANALEGSFQLSGTQILEIELDPFNQTSGPLTTATLSNNSLSFSPDIAAVGLTSKGDFSPFNIAQIQNIITFNPFVAENPFLDLGSGAATSVNGNLNSTITDGQNVFNLENAEYHVKTGADNLVEIGVMLYGEFDVNGETTAGQGLLTLQVAQQGATVDSVTNEINSADGLSDLALSGAVFTVASTPEPTVLFGLGVVATGLVASRRKKNA
ncbi:MAG: PEP-CTERM sorting domain-containing protein [Trichodesmium sp.]